MTFRGLFPSGRGGVAEVLRIAWPLVLAQAAGAVNHVCDRLFLARCADGDSALAASLPAMMVAVMFVAFFSTTLGYSGVFVSQLHGARRGVDAVRAFAQGLWLLLFSLPLVVLFVPVSRAVVDLAGHAEAVCAAEKAYLCVYAPGGAFTILNVILGGVITGQGRTLFVSFATFAGCLVNLALDPLFIYGAGPVPAMGLTGAAVAFVCAGAATSALLVAAVCRDPLVVEGFRKGAFAFARALSLRVLRYGSPAGAAAFAGSLTFTVFTLVVGRLDALSSAASNTVFAVNNVFYLALCATTEGVRILTGRYHGAGDDEAACRVYRSGLLLVLVALVACFLVAIPGAGFIMDLFRGAGSSFDPALYRRTGLCLFSIMFFREIAEAVSLVTEGALRGVGDTRYMMVVQLAVRLLVWLPLVLAVAKFHPTVAALWLTMPFALGLVAALLYLRWRRGAWRRRSLVG